MCCSGRILTAVLHHKLAVEGLISFPLAWSGPSSPWNCLEKFWSGVLSNSDSSRCHEKDSRRVLATMVPYMCGEGGRQGSLYQVPGYTFILLSELDSLGYILHCRLHSSIATAMALRFCFLHHFFVTAEGISSGSPGAAGFVSFLWGV